MQPEFAAIHELAAHLPMECIAIRQPSFGGFHWPMIGRHPGLRARLPGRDGLSPRGAAEPPARRAAPDLGAQDARVPDDARPAVRDLSRRRGRSSRTAIRSRRCRRASARSPPCAGCAATTSSSRSIDGYGCGAPAARADAARAGRHAARAELVHVQFADLMRDPVGAMERLYGGMGRPFQAAHADTDPRLPRPQAEGQVRRAQVHRRRTGASTPARIRRDAGAVHGVLPRPARGLIRECATSTAGSCRRPRTARP